MANIIQRLLSAPLTTQLIDKSGLVSSVWEVFFKSITESLNQLGFEKYFEIANNKASATDISGLQFDKAVVSQVTVEYLVQRITTGGSGVDLIESGIFILVYRPKTDTWAKVDVKIDSPNDSGVTFSVTSTGQVKYTSSNVAGTASISRLTYRARTLKSKNYQYSRK
jgi:hypothetical protein